MGMKILCLFCVTLLSEASSQGINIPGNITIVGLFDIWQTENGKCSTNIDVNSVMISEAVKWYITQINKHGGLSFDFGFEAFSTCGLPSEAGKLTVDILNDNTPHNVIGIIGPEQSAESEVTSSIISSLPDDEMLVQLSFSATDVMLGNKTKYKNLIRLVPDNDVEIEAMIKSMLKLKWNRISIVFEESEYGRDGARRLHDMADQNDICVSEMYSVNIDGGVDVGQVSSIFNNIMFGSDLRPASTGIVLFATSSTINTILRSMSTINISPVPIVMVSDALNMNVNELLRPSDNGLEVIPTAKGMIAVTPPYLEIVEFSDHWRKLFTDNTLFNEESVTNPYIKDVYETLSQCDKTDCVFTPLSNANFEVQPLYLQYAVVATHALITDFITRVESYCSEDSTLCEDFKGSFQPSELINSMKGMTLNFNEDLNWWLESMSNNSTIWKLDSSGELLQADDQPKYELYNYQNDKDDSTSTFSLIKVGEYIGSNMIIEYDKLRDYTLNGEVTLWPDIRKAFCPSGKLCSECLEKQQIHETVYFQPGDRYVVGVVPVFNTDNIRGCGTIRPNIGYQAVEAIKYVVENINNRAFTYSSYFPGMNIGLVILNSCNNHVVIQRKIYQLHYTGVKLPNGETFILDMDKVIGYVGEVTSGLSMAMAEMISRLPLVQISYASSSDKLSDRNRYPHFMRVVTPITPMSKAIVEVIKDINSDYIQIVHSDTEYGNNGKESIIEAAIENNICVIQNIPVEENFNEYEIYDKLRRYPHARVVVVFLHSHKTLTFVKAIVSQMQRGEFTFIGSQTWHHTKNLLDVDSSQYLLGSYSLAFEMKQDERLLQRINSLTPQPFSVDPWRTPFLQARGDCHFNESFDKRYPAQCSNDNTKYQLDYLDTYAVLATTGLLTGANSFLHKTCSFNDFKQCPPFSDDVDGLMDEIRKVELDVDGTGLKSRIFNQNNDGNIGFRIYKITRDPFNITKMQYVQVGRYSLDGNFDFTDEESNVVSTCPNKLACKNCGLRSDDNQVMDNNNDAKDVNTDIILGILVAVFGTIIILLILVIVKLCRVFRAYKTKDIYITPFDENGRRPQPCVPEEPLPTTEE